MDVQLTVQTGGRADRTVSIDVPEFVIGRDPSCQYRIESDRVSSRHCRIVQAYGRVMLEDLNSTNGTLVNNRQIQSIELQDGDRLKIGSTNFQVKIRTNAQDLEKRAEDWIAGSMNLRQGYAISSPLESRTDSPLVESARNVLARMTGQPDQDRPLDRVRLRVTDQQGITVARLLDDALIEELDIQRVGEELDALIRAGRTRLVVNLEEVVHLSSQAVASLLALHRRCLSGGGLLKLCKLRPQVAEIAKLLGLSRLVEISPNERSALAGDWPPEPVPVAPQIGPAATQIGPAATQIGPAATQIGPAPADRPAPAAPKPQPEDSLFQKPAPSAAQPAPVAPLAQVRLIVQSGRAKGQAVEIQSSRFVIGRDTRCNLKPNSSTISRIHAVIEQRDGRVFINDPGTVNGTLINDRQIRGQEVEVANEDRLTLGPLVFTFSIQSPTPGEAPGGSEESAAPWLVEGGEADSEGSTVLYNTLPAKKPAPPAPTPQPQAQAQPKAPSEPVAAAGDAKVRVHHLRFEVLHGVLVVTILTPDLNDEPTVGPVRFELLTLFEQALPRRVVINLENVTYLSSRAVGVLLAHYQRLDKAGGALRVCHVHPNVTAILNQMRLPIIVEVFPSVDEAVLAPWD